MSAFTAARLRRDGTKVPMEEVMLLFELIPAFVMVCALIAGIGLFVADRQARREPVHQESGAWRRPRT